MSLHQDVTDGDSISCWIAVIRKGFELLTNTLTAQRPKIARQYGLLYEHCCLGVTDSLLELAAQMNAQSTQEERHDQSNTN